MTNLTDFLNWLVYSGGALLAASWLLDKIPAFVALPSPTKKIINQVVSIVLALGAYAFLTYMPADIMAQIGPWFAIAAGTVILYSGQQVIHQQTKQ